MSDFKYIVPREEIQKLANCTKRSLVKDRTMKVITINGKRYCAWCGKGEVSGRQKYCSPDCCESSDVFAYPQANRSMAFFLRRQGYKCNICGYDYNPIIEEALKSHPIDRMGAATWLRFKAPKERKPEVDHIIPIFRGGSGIGVDNHQVICHACHLIKNKQDRIPSEWE